jgi:hypothetical protein
MHFGLNTMAGGEHREKGGWGWGISWHAARSERRRKPLPKTSALRQLSTPRISPLTTPQQYHNNPVRIAASFKP